MSFSKGLTKIFESIQKTAAPKRERLFEKAIDKIAENPFLAFKYALQEAVVEQKGKLSEASCKAFINKLNGSVAGFIKENKPEVSSFRNAEKELFEFFNVNHKEIMPEKIDFVFNPKTFAINESIIREIVLNKQFMTITEAIGMKRNEQKAQYTNIKHEVNYAGLNDKLEFTEAIAKFVKDATKTKFINESLDVIRKELVENFPSAVEKAYKLRMLVEKSMDPFDAMEEDTSKSVKMNTHGMQYVREGSITIPTEDEAAVVSFQIPIYPTSKLSDNLVNMKKLLGFLQGIKSVFNSALESIDGRKTFQRSDMRYLVNLPISEPYGAKLGANGEVINKSYPASFEIIIFTNPEAVIDQEEIISKITAAVKAFEEMLANMDQVKDFLTPAAQTEYLQDNGGARKTKYDKRDGADKYYKDKESDDWMNSLLGDGEESDFRAKKDDKEYFGDANGDFEDQDEFASDLDDDKIAATAERKAMRSVRK